MNINFILKKMNITHKCIGNEAFDTLALASTNINEKFCTFVTDSKYISALSKNANVVLITEELSDKIVHKGKCIVDNPRMIFFQLHNFLQDYNCYRRKKEKNIIGDNCKISNLACIADNNVSIGNNVIIEEFVSIKENTMIEDNCIIRAGSVIGGEGFEFKRDLNNNLFGVTHLGGVILKGNSEVQQNSCVDKAIYPWDDTIVGEFSRVDNNVHIAHGVKIGKNTMIVANSGIAGRTIIGDNCWVGFNSTIRNGLIIGNNTRINMGAVVTKNVNDRESVTGNFAIPHDIFIRKLKENI